MKKLLSISFAFIILLSGMHFTIATHFCGGEIAASKVSVSGELATCGMESGDNQCPSDGQFIGSRCCNDFVSVLAVDTSYSPSYCEFKAFSLNIPQIFQVPGSFLNNSPEYINLFSINKSPPGTFLVSYVSLPTICVFRI
jgi:hypothetical protein